MSVENNRGKGKYYFRSRNQGKSTNIQEKSHSRAHSPEPRTQSSPAHTPNRQFPPSDSQTMATDGGQPVLDASVPPPSGQANPNTTENSMLAEIRKMFSAFSNKIEVKLDNVISDFNSLKEEMASLKTTTDALEKSTQDTSDRIHDVEAEKLPQLERKLAKVKSEIDDKLLQLELHNRKQNLLFYGIAPRPQEDAYALVTEEIAKLLNISMEIAGNIPINNAHRLPDTTTNPRHRKEQPPRPHNRPFRQDV